MRKMGITESLKNVGMFLIFAQIILNFCPDDKYIRYIRVLLGIMVIIQVLNPVLSLLRLI